MTTQLKKYWQLFWKFRQLRLMALMEYRGDFFFWAFISIMWTGFNYFFFDLILNVNGSIGGWSKPEIFLLLSTFTILDSFTWSFFYNNMQNFTRAVFQGDLGMYLTAPIDTQFLLTIQDNSYDSLPRLVIGAAGVWWSLQQLHITPSIATMSLYMICMIASLLFIYSFWFFLSTLTFWVEKLDNVNEIIPMTRRAWQVPRSVFVGFSSTIFTVLIPVGLVVTLPSEILLGQTAAGWIAYLAVFAVVSFLFSRWFFHFSLRKYSSVGN